MSNISLLSDIKISDSSRVAAFICFHYLCKAKQTNLLQLLAGVQVCTLQISRLNVALTLCLLY